MLLIAHSANRWALEHLLLGTALEELVVAPFEWQEGWTYRLGLEEGTPGLDSSYGQGASAPDRLRASARASAAADRVGRRGGARGAGCHARQALDQARGEDVRARPRRPDDGSDDARGRGHAGQGGRAFLEGHPPRPGRSDRPLRRGDLRLPQSRSDRGRADAWHERQGRVGCDRVSFRSDADVRQGRGGPRGGRDGRGRDRHGDRPGRLPLRPLREGLRRDRPGEGGGRRPGT